MQKTVKLQRYSGNPVLRPNPENPWEAQNVSNAGAAIHDGKVHLLYRAEGFEPRAEYHTWPVASLGLAVSSDGYNFERFDKPALMKTGKDHEAWAVEDPRIAKIDETYYITYVCTSLHGDHIALATTKDFKSFKRHGLIMPEISQRTSGLFPGRIKGRYVLMHRITPGMWISFSDDLRTWTDTTCILAPKAGTWYNLKLGIGATPIEQDDGWLVFWHAKALDENSPYGMYRLGVLWLNKDDPTKIIKLQEEPVLEVELEMEKQGYYRNVVYTCGAVELNEQYFVYYGCADRVCSVATVPVEDCRL
ncbi:MAG: glycosidase [Planctomycetota bacterium]